MSPRLRLLLGGTMHPVPEERMTLRQPLGVLRWDLDDGVASGQRVEPTAGPAAQAATQPER